MHSFRLAIISDGNIEINRTGFNSYNSIIIIINNLIVRLYTVMIRQIIIVQTKFEVPIILTN